MKHLPGHGWSPIVLTAQPRAYARADPDLLADLSPDLVVVRTFAFDTARHLSIRGRYPFLLAWPDRYASWVLTSTIKGLQLIRRHKPAALWSTFPVTSAHLVGWLLHRCTGIPWVADFRDSMIDDSFPTDPKYRCANQRVERMTVRDASHCVFTTRGARAMYAARYHEVQGERCSVIPNGFDEAHFREAETSLHSTVQNDCRLRLLHSGLLYSAERNPIPFFEAVRALKEGGAISAVGVQIILRASGEEERYRRLLVKLAVDDLIELAPPLPYRESLAEMLSADGLLLFQGASCNHQIPAKLYEYFRAGRPVFALTDPAGDTAGELRAAGVGTVVPLDDTNQIALGLARFVSGIRAGREHGMGPSAAARYAREGGVAQLAEILRRVTKGSGEFS